jgi:hypothetical protein
MSITFSPRWDPRNADFPGDNLNVNNANAGVLFESLQLGDHGDPYQGGEIRADELLARIAASAELDPPDLGRESSVDDEPGHATMIDCGRRPGYLQDRLLDLRRVALEAERRGVGVTWG